MTTAAAKIMTQTWQPLCHRDDLVPFSGIAAWIETDEGPAQIAIFYIPVGPNTPGEADHECELFALDHHDPFANANVIARGIVGDLQGEPVVASPIYKQHFRLADGQCLENDDVKLRTWPVGLEGDQVMIQA
ncbi:nitrite reductase small subunit NirD [Halomonas lysinitropha]|uniref:Nitrite reductase (NADH) small subunit n=1 Tax=Halomonas lysinitropha TaxID=2607506 RepID=A0A5K1I7M7_9GAMM|nr:nitrite reductase small subunit NirD [Halomonas lysinitropha]VVZ96187.1 Nitrite reductase (NADH) small subunit [Halomonas lysinitropha]